MYKRYLCAGFAALALSANADDMLFRQGDTAIRLTQGDCAVPQAIVMLWGVAEKTAHAAEVTEGQRKTAACWVLDADADVAIVTEDGRGGFIPAAAFKRAVGI